MELGLVLQREEMARFRVRGADGGRVEAGGEEAAAEAVLVEDVLQVEQDLELLVEETAPLHELRLLGLRGHHRAVCRKTSESRELRESTDCFADVTVSDSLSAIVKVGVNSGELYMADLRKLDAGDPWLCLGNARKAGNGKKEGSGCRLESYGDQEFCNRGGEVEMWSEVVMGGGWSSEEGPAGKADGLVWRSGTRNGGGVKGSREVAFRISVSLPPKYESFGSEVFAPNEAFRIRTCDPNPI